MIDLILFMSKESKYLHVLVYFSYLSCGKGASDGG